jgi:hypothetical protein
MLGRYCTGGCACRDCGDGQPDTRWRKRVEARELAAEFAVFAAEAAERAGRVQMAADLCVILKS